jgi:S1-C subfamily serine protease
MKYSSVVSLKRQLFGEKTVASRALTMARTKGMMRGASPASIVSVPRASIALGVTGKNGKFQLAVRVHERSEGIDIVLDDIRRRCKGEMSVKIIGNVVKQAHWHQSKNRPLRIGGSVGHFQITAGTLGCFVTKRGDEDFILSNNHVLANENRARVGANIIQPGDADGGKNPRDKVGDLKQFVPLRKKGNLVDCAMATIDEGLDYLFNELESLGPIRGVRNDPVEDGETVFKVGRTTGVTEGRVSAIEVDRVRVNFDMGVIEFDSQIEIEPVGNAPFSLGGDSGSLIVDSKRQAVGLLFAGNDIDVTYANEIHNVLAALNVDLVF